MQALLKLTRATCIERIKSEIGEIKSSLKILENDTDREKSIIIDAKSNEKRLKEEKQELIDIDSKYYETEKQSNDDLDFSLNFQNQNY